jgi:hypothetical protein
MDPDVRQRETVQLNEAVNEKPGGTDLSPPAVLPAFFKHTGNCHVYMPYRCGI